MINPYLIFFFDKSVFVYLYLIALDFPTSGYPVSDFPISGYPLLDFPIPDNPMPGAVAVRKWCMPYTPFDRHIERVV